MAKLLTRTPIRITEPISSLCYEIDKSQRPYFVRVKPESWAVSLECFQNVKTKVEKDGGQIQFGWTIGEWPNVMLAAEFHTIWVSSAGEHIDITPRQTENKILFLPDSLRKYDYTLDCCRISNRYWPLSDDHRVLELIAAKQELFNIEETHSTGRSVKLEGSTLERAEELGRRIAWITLQLMPQLQPQLEHNKTGRNNPCPCGSGRKFKKCCGEQL